MIASMYPRLIAAGVLVAGCLGAWFYVSHLKGKIENLETAIVLEQGKAQAAMQEVERVTQAKSALDLSLKEAEVNRQALVKSYSARLKALQGQKPPTECKDVIDWAIENRGDLAWETK